MTATSLSLNKYELIASICKDSFEEFVRRFWHCVPGAGKLKWNWHLSLFCEEFEKIVRNIIAGKPKEYDLVVNVPPGTSKSTIFSILGPAWCWTVAPWMRIMSASNSDNLVTDLSSKSRDVIQSELYQKCFPEIVFREAQDAKGYFANTLGGDRFTCTVAGKSPIGFHSHLQIVDDGLDPKRMTSKADVKTAAEFMTNVLPTRKVDKATTVMILVMQRLGVGDPTDVVLEESKKDGAGKVRHICLPSDLVRGDDGAFLESDVKPQELAKRYIDGLLDPDRLGVEVIREAKARGAHHYDTQFRQKPFNKSGGMFKEKYFLKRVKAAPFKAKRVVFWDRAFSAEEYSCNTAGTVMAWDGENVYVGPVRVGRWMPDERDDQIVGLAQQCRDRFTEGANEPTHVIEVEPAAGEDSYRYLAKKLAGFKVVGEKAKGNKEQRAQPWASQCAAGNVYIVEEGWIGGTIQEWIDEHCAFPNMDLKDRVDSASAAFNWLFRRKTGGNVVQARTINPGKKAGIRILFMDAAEAEQSIINEPSLLVQILSPAREGVMWNDADMGLEQRFNGQPGNVALAVGENGDNSQSLPHGLNRCLGQVAIAFADVDPADHQQSWDSPIPPFNLPCEKIMANAEHAKAMWACLLKEQSPVKPEVIAVMDDTDGRRAQSAAMAICDAMGLPRPQHLSRPDEAWQAGKSDPPPNRHIHETMKKGRWSIPGR